MLPPKSWRSACAVVPSRLRYEAVFAASAVEFSVGLSRRRQRKLLDRANELAKRLVAVEEPALGDRAWVRELRGPLKLAESVDCALADQEDDSSGHTGQNRTIYMLVTITRQRF